MKCKCPKGFPITSWDPFDDVLITTGAGPRKKRVYGVFRRHTGKCPLHDELVRIRRMP